MRKFTSFIENLLSALTHYPRAERNGVITIAVVMVSVLGWFVFHPAPPLDVSYLAEADRLNDSLRTDYFQKRRAAGSFYVRADSLSTSTPAATPLAPAGKAAVYIELNTADSAELCTVRGIGPVISKNILQYRKRLGGFVHKNQLKEVWGITDENFESISRQFFIDTAVIQKINLNFVPANSLRSHPYFTGSMVDRITGARKLKGGWKQLRDLVDNDILLPGEAEKVAPYVLFDTL